MYVFVVVCVERICSPCQRIFFGRIVVTSSFAQSCDCAENSSAKLHESCVIGPEEKSCWQEKVYASSSIFSVRFGRYVRLETSKGSLEFPMVLREFKNSLVPLQENRYLDRFDNLSEKGRGISCNAFFRYMPWTQLSILLNTCYIIYYRFSCSL